MSELKTGTLVVEHSQLRAPADVRPGLLSRGDLPLIRFPLGRPGWPRHLRGVGEHTAEIL